MNALDKAFVGAMSLGFVACAGSAIYRFSVGEGAGGTVSLLLAAALVLPILHTIKESTK